MGGCTFEYTEKRGRQMESEEVRLIGMGDREGGEGWETGGDQTGFEGESGPQTAPVTYSAWLPLP